MGWASSVNLSRMYYLDKLACHYNKVSESENIRHVLFPPVHLPLSNQMLFPTSALVRIPNYMLLPSVHLSLLNHMLTPAFT